MQPNCPSGEERGETVTDRRQRRGIARPAHAQHGRPGKPLAAPEAHAEGLVLTANGVADPKQDEGKVSPNGLASDQRKGWKPHGRDRLRRARFTTARPSNVHWRVRQDRRSVVVSLSMDDALFLMGFQQHPDILTRAGCRMPQAGPGKGKAHAGSV